MQNPTQVSPQEFVESLKEQTDANLRNPTIPFPDPVVGVGILVKDQWSIRGGAYDTNNVFGDFEFFPDGGELLSHFEVGWSPSRGRVRELDLL